MPHPSTIKIDPISPPITVRQLVEALNRFPEEAYVSSKSTYAIGLYTHDGVQFAEIITRQLVTH